MPDDCLVDADGARADYMFARVFLAKTNYYFWIYTLNPISQTRTYAASTIFNDQRVHETSFRSSRSQLLGAVIPGSYAANVTHRAVLKIFSASGLQGQRGSLVYKFTSPFENTDSPVLLDQAIITLILYHILNTILIESLQHCTIPLESCSTKHLYCPKS